MEFLSPLRYPGGKAKVADFVQCLIKENALLDGTYVEPYVGGGSVALSLLFNEYVRDIYINDKDISKEGDEVVRGAILFVIGEENTELGYQIQFEEKNINPMEFINIDG